MIPLAETGIQAREDDNQSLEGRSDMTSRKCELIFGAVEIGTKAKCEEKTWSSRHMVKVCLTANVDAHIACLVHSIHFE